MEVPGRRRAAAALARRPRASSSRVLVAHARRDGVPLALRRPRRSRARTREQPYELRIDGADVPRRLRAGARAGRASSAATRTGAARSGCRSTTWSSRRCSASRTTTASRCKVECPTGSGKYDDALGGRGGALAPPHRASSPPDARRAVAPRTAARPAPARSRTSGTTSRSTSTSTATPARASARAPDGLDGARGEAARAVAAVAELTPRTRQYPIAFIPALFISRTSARTAAGGAAGAAAAARAGARPPSARPSSSFLRASSSFVRAASSRRFFSAAASWLCGLREVARADVLRRLDLRLRGLEHRHHRVRLRVRVARRPRSDRRSSMPARAPPARARRRSRRVVEREAHARERPLRPRRPPRSRRTRTSASRCWPAKSAPSGMRTAPFAAPTRCARPRRPEHDPGAGTTSIDAWSATVDAEQVDLVLERRLHLARVAHVEEATARPLGDRVERALVVVEAHAERGDLRAERERSAARARRAPRRRGAHVGLAVRDHHDAAHRVVGRRPARRASRRARSPSNMFVEPPVPSSASDREHPRPRLRRQAHRRDERSRAWSLKVSTDRMSPSARRSTSGRAEARAAWILAPSIEPDVSMTSARSTGARTRARRRRGHVHPHADEPVARRARGRRRCPPPRPPTGPAAPSGASPTGAAGADLGVRRGRRRAPARASAASSGPRCATGALAHPASTTIPTSPTADRRSTHCAGFLQVQGRRDTREPKDLASAPWHKSASPHVAAAFDAAYFRRYYESRRSRVYGREQVDRPGPRGHRVRAVVRRGHREGARRRGGHRALEGLVPREPAAGALPVAST